jgi:preprotein translocase subunit SecG
MVLTLFNIVYVLVAIAMIILILLQRGSGAQAGSGFGGGASGTVFGARGASTFLSRSTAILAALFFVLSLAMAWYLGHADVSKPSDDLGVMSGVEVPAAPKPPAAPAASGDVPAASTAPAVAPTVPASAAPDAMSATPAPAKKDDVPAAPRNDKKPADTKKH